MATPKNATYKIDQEDRRIASRKGRYAFRHSFGVKKSAQAVRDGKVNKKYGRVLATAYV